MEQLLRDRASFKKIWYLRFVVCQNPDLIKGTLLLTRYFPKDPLLPKYNIRRSKTVLYFISLLFSLLFVLLIFLLPLFLCSLLTILTVQLNTEGRFLIEQSMDIPVPIGVPTLPFDVLGMTLGASCQFRKVEWVYNGKWPHI